jgi:O-6-methylguanine DNA methyltransferase
MVANTETSPIEFELPIPTPNGEFLARYSGKGLCGLSFPLRTQKQTRPASPAQAPPRVRDWHAKTTDALALALAGQPLGSLPPLDLSTGTAFQQLVWQTLCKIPFGRTWTYSEVAQTIGNPKAVRAVGGACGANPIPVFVPCHRVLAGQFAARGVLGRLALETDVARLRRNSGGRRGNGARGRSTILRRENGVVGAGESALTQGRLRIRFLFLLSDVFLCGGGEFVPDFKSDDRAK